MGSNICCRLRLLMHSCTPAILRNVIRHLAEHSGKFLPKQISHDKLWELIVRWLYTRFTWHFQWMLSLCLRVHFLKIFSLHRHFNKRINIYIQFQIPLQLLNFVYWIFPQSDEIKRAHLIFYRKTDLHHVFLQKGQYPSKRFPR